jgi:hypothetical protein
MDKSRGRSKDKSRGKSRFRAKAPVRADRGRRGGHSTGSRHHPSRPALLLLLVQLLLLLLLPRRGCAVSERVTRGIFVLDAEVAVARALRPEDGAAAGRNTLVLRRRK